MYSRQLKKKDSITSYLDVGAGDQANLNLFRGKTNAQYAVGIDIRRNLSKPADVELVRADAAALPFRPLSFQLVTMISVVEHVSNQIACVSEAVRVLRADGDLFIQLPNRYFPIELHSGLFMYFYLPKIARLWLARIAEQPWMERIDIPSARKLVRMLRECKPRHAIVTHGFFYPKSLLPESKLLRSIHEVLRILGIFRILPMGYIVLVRANNRADGKNVFT